MIPLIFLFLTYFYFFMISKYFQFHSHQTNLKRECFAGLSTFATMAYILVVNATILNGGGIDYGAALVSAIIVTAFACSLMGFLTNFPIAIAPGMGASGYIVYTAIHIQGYSWQECLGAVFVVGVILLILTLLRLREKLINEIPNALKLGITGGVGLFLICVGLSNVGLIYRSKVFIALGEIWTLQAGLMLAGVAVITILELLNVSSAYIITILLAWVASLALGITRFEGLIALPPSLAPTFLKLNLSGFFSWSFLKVLFSLFLVTLLDSSVALHTLGKQANLLDKKGNLIKIRSALLPDALGTMLGGLIGTGSLAIHLESSAGIKAGGKSGWVALFVAFAFLSCLFFYPILITIPTFAPASVLVVLGFFMFKETFHLPFRKITEVIPAALTVLIMPLTMSIFNGFALGFISYVALKIFTGKTREVHALVWILAVLFLVYKIFLDL